MLMIVVMVALLAGSLGLAQWLLAWRQAAVVMAFFPPPPGVPRLPVNESADEVLRGRYSIAQGRWPQGPRQFVAFCFPARPGVSSWVYLSTLFSRLADAHPDEPFPSSISTLAGYPAVQVEADSQSDDIPAFSIMRLANVSGCIVAFCFSGTGDFTDDDWRFFDDYCTRQIRIREAHSSRKQG
jgi:hypothetical protein